MQILFNDQPMQCVAGLTVHELLEQLEASFDDGKAEEHMPRAKNFVDGVKQFWSRVTS